MEELITIENDVAVIDASLVAELLELERQAKLIKEEEDKLKARIKEEMENKKIIKLESDVITISYIAPTTRETFDSKKLKADDPDLYDSYVKLSDVASSVRIKAK